MTGQGGFGVVLKINTGALTAIVNVEDVDFPEFEKILSESTAHDSTTGYAEYIATGKRKLNEFPCTITWDTSEATHAQVVTSFGSDDPVGMSIEDPDSDETIAFDAHIRAMTRISKQEEHYKCDVAIQPTGAPTIT